MDKTRWKRLQKQGWTEGSAGDFLDLTPEEATYVEIRLRLADLARELRRASRLTQRQVADRLGSSQSRIAKLEAADPSVSLDLMVRSILSLGGGKREIARSVAESP